ncbi:putative S-adenosylmethionine-dependent methyltransferase [compost metagenome]
MDFTGERYIPEKAFGEIETEHKQRYHSIIKLVKGKVVVDAACGEGYGSSLLAEYADQVYGIDISEETIGWAKGKYNAPNLQFSQGSIESLVFPDHSIDVVVSFETIEHVDSIIQEKFMNEIKRVLKPDGILVISTPDKQVYSNNRKFRNPYHVKEFYREEFSFFLRSFFENVAIFNQGFETFSVMNQKDDEKDYQLINPNKLNKSESMYMVGVCTDKKLPDLSNMSNIMLMKQNPNITSRLFVNFGMGYSEEVVIYANLVKNGKEFTVEFTGLNELEGIKGLQWEPLREKFMRLEILNSFPHEIHFRPIDRWQQKEGVDYFLNQAPRYEVEINDFESLKQLTIVGNLETYNQEILYENLISQINHLQTEVSHKQEQVKIQNKLEELSTHLENQLSQLLDEKDEAKAQLVVLERKNQALMGNSQKMLSDFDKEISSLRSYTNQIEYEKNQLFHERNYLISIYEEKDRFANSLLNSSSWKLTKPLRSLRIYASSSKKKVKKLAKYLARGIYKAIPLSKRSKTAIKDMIYTRLRFLLKNTGMYKIWLESKNEIVYRENRFSILAQSGLELLGEVNKQPGTIAIHLHLYYVDLLDEFFDYFSNIPFHFDLYVSVTQESSVDKVYRKFITMPNTDKVVVKVTPNRGRDVAPMFAEFGEALKEYDFISHVHSKKSLYTGTEQDGWRKHLLDNLFGDPLVLKRIFFLFEKHRDLGLIYPETYRTIPYWAHTWLSNKGIGGKLLSRLGVKHDYNKYLDFPAGTMYWARTAALMPLFNLNLNYEDFDEEAKQIDGTIAHAIERAMVPIVNHTGFAFAEINVYRDEYRFNKGSRNLHQYWPRKLNELKDIIDGVEVVTFDIFDTLITRPLLSPDTVFKLIQLKALEFIQDLDFITIRKEAESEVRKDKGFIGDCDIDEIYDKMGKLYRLSSETIERIKNIEIEMELKLSIPRSEVIEILNYAKFKGKKIILISDMYLKKAHIENMLEQCNISYYDEIWLSSETGRRKDNGTVWDYFVEEFKGRRTLHIGDNEHSDVQIAEGKGLVVYHVMSGTNMFYNTDFGNYIGHQAELNNSWGDSLLLGPIVAKEFNSPFKLSYTNGKYQITDLKTLGYAIFAPLLFNFTIWLIKQLQESNHDQVFFLAREGYLLKKLYDLTILELSSVSQSIKEMKTSYFLTSRRAASVASLKSREDIKELLDISYEGTINDLLRVRFGILSKEEQLNQFIKLPENKDSTYTKIEPYFDEIFKNAETERIGYLKYIEHNNLMGKDIAVVDVGYSGTIQYYISKLLDQSTTGYYFVTSNKIKGTSYKGNRMYGCFGENENYLTTSSAIYKYQLLLESILTSDQGQLINFEVNQYEKTNPSFGSHGFAQHNFNNLMQVMEGIEEYFIDILRYYKDSILEVPLSNLIPDKLIDSTMLFEDLVSDQIKKMFIVEDTYCMSTEISVFDHYKQWFGL